MKSATFAQKITFILFLFGLLTTSSQLSAQNTALVYGDAIHLQNAWGDYTGGFLDTRGYDKEYEKTGNHLCVSTAISNKRALGTGTWKVLSATGKAIGTPVLLGDEIHLQNAWENYTGGFLDTRGTPAEFEKNNLGNLRCVSTAIDKKRDGGSGTWKVTSAKGMTNGKPVTLNSDVHLQNAFENYTGGFLDIRGTQAAFKTTGNLNCVSTATSATRDNGASGTWKITISK